MRFLEALRGDIQRVKDLTRGCLVRLLLLLNVRLESGEIGRGLASEVLATLRLGCLLELGVLELGELTRVLEHLDEALLVEGLLWRFCDGTNGFDSSLKESFFIQTSGVNLGHLSLLVVLGLGLTL